MNLNARARLTEYLTLTRKGSEAFWSRLKKYFLVSVLVEVLTGLTVMLFDTVVVQLWGRIGTDMGPVSVALMPTLGLLLFGLCLQYLTSDPESMTRDVITARRDMLVGGIVELMSSHDVGHVPVVNGGEGRDVVGMVSTSDIIALDEVRASWQWRRVGPDSRRTPSIRTFSTERVHRARAWRGRGRGVH